MSGFADQVAAAVAAAPFGRPTAAKRGRNPRFPWVPVVDYGPQDTGVDTTRTWQIPARAFATRNEAVRCAAEYIAAGRDRLERDLQHPRMRALREQHGLPRELPEGEVEA